MRGWWLSFTCPDGWLGGIIVMASSFPEAVRVSHILKINPGGEVMGHPMLDENVKLIPKEYIERLLSKDDCREIDKIFGGEGEVSRVEIPSSEHNAGADT